MYMWRLHQYANSLIKFMFLNLLENNFFYNRLLQFSERNDTKLRMYEELETMINDYSFQIIY